jgi:hypothetical protein
MFTIMFSLLHCHVSYESQIRPRRSSRICFFRFLLRFFAAPLLPRRCFPGTPFCRTAIFAQRRRAAEDVCATPPPGARSAADLRLMVFSAADRFPAARCYFAAVTSSIDGHIYFASLAPAPLRRYFRCLRHAAAVARAARPACLMPSADLARRAMPHRRCRRATPPPAEARAAFRLFCFRLPPVIIAIASSAEMPALPIATG